MILDTLEGRALISKALDKVHSMIIHLPQNKVKEEKSRIFSSHCSPSVTAEENPKKKKKTRRPDLGKHSK